MPGAAVPATSSTSPAACSAAMRHHPFHGRRSARLGIASGAPLYVVRLDAEHHRVVSDRARRCAPCGCGLVT